MKEKWYYKITNQILDIKTDIILIEDPAKIILSSKIKECLSEKFNNIVEFKSEVQIRAQIRRNEKILVIFSSNENIPYDFLSTYATTKIDLDSVFPLLNLKALLQYPVEQYQEIFEAHEEFKKDNYERLSEQETIIFIDRIVPKELLKRKEDAVKLITQIENLLKNEILNPDDWGKISQYYGELNYLIDNNKLDLDINILRDNLKNKFTSFIVNNYEDLAYSPTSLIHFNILENIFHNSYQKNALICFDCMGFEEWNVIKDYLNQSNRFDYIIKYSFAMLPSETNYSGNALFGGLPPKRIKELNFINTIHWKNEEQLFKYFLSKRKRIEEHNIFFKRYIEVNDTLLDEECLKDYKAAGLVFSFIDRFTHTDLMNKNRLINNIRTYIQKSRLDAFVDILLKNEFRIFFVSDHGSIFCQGNGINVKKDLVDSKAKRYLISNKKELLDEYKVNDSELVQFKHIIGDEYLLLLSGNEMFAGKNESGLDHGGISIEEVVVPFIEVKYSDRL